MKARAVEYEVWRSGPNPKGADVRLYHGMTDKRAREVLAERRADKADGYPDAPIEFYLVRAVMTRTRHAEKDAELRCNWPQCNSPQVGRCFAWCKCRCHSTTTEPEEGA